MKNLMIANWKSHKSIREAEEWLRVFEQALHMHIALGDLPHEIVVAPAASLLGHVVSVCERSPLQKLLQFGVQDLSPFPEGAYTGAISIKNLEGLPVSYAILGHSERRTYFGETALDVAKKVEQCLAAGIHPVVCVDREQVATQAAQFSATQIKKMTIAYEPIEYIGKGKAQPLAMVEEVVDEITAAFGAIPVLYGGSVNEDTIADFRRSPHLSGFLVGTASLDPLQFAEMVK